MTLMSRGQDFLNRKLKAAAGVDAVYSRGGTSLALTVTLGRTVFRQASMGQAGASIIWGDLDCLVTVADLVSLGEPQAGDRIVISQGTFEAMVPETGEPAWRYSDPERTRYRIHWKKVGA